MYIYIYICIHVHVHVHIYVYVYMYINIHKCVIMLHYISTNITLSVVHDIAVQS